MRLRLVVLTGTCACAAIVLHAQQPAARGQAPAAQTAGQGRSTNLGTDPNGNPIRMALKTGHVSNYDEGKVGRYSLPDPLVSSDGKPVQSAATWMRQRRPEIIRLYENVIFGAIPATTPKVAWQVAETDPSARGGTALHKRIVGRIGTGADGPAINLNLFIPAQA